MDDTHHSPLPVAGRAIRRWKENMSGQTIRRSRVAAYFGQGFYPVGFVRYIYMYTHTHARQLFFLLADYTGIRDHRGGRARSAI